MTNIQFLIVTSWDSESIIQLYSEAGWWRNDYDPAEIPNLILGSFIFMVGIDQDTQKTVAMGRIISDRLSTAIIQDMCVLHQYRGEGIGRKLLAELTSAAAKSGINRIMLVAETGTREFYKKSGFKSNYNQIFLLKN